MIPVTYYPTSTQRQLQKNRELVADKPYAHFFREDMWLREEALPALKAPMDPALALRTTSSDLNRLLEPGYHEVETGYCAMAAADIHASACGHVYLRRPRLHSATMVHLVRDTDDGFELRSRYWLGDRISLGRGDRPLGLDRLAGALGLKARLAGERLAYEQLLHDQIEFTHLAGILPGLFAEFGPGKNAE